MNYSNQNYVYSKKNHVKIGANLTQITLKEVPIEIRKRAARKPLFLKRYE
jgi:hypothetical protein